MAQTSPRAVGRLRTNRHTSRPRQPSAPTAVPRVKEETPQRPLLAPLVPCMLRCEKALSHHRPSRTTESDEKATAPQGCSRRPSPRQQSAAARPGPINQPAQQKKEPPPSPAPQLLCPLSSNTDPHARPGPSCRPCSPRADQRRPSGHRRALRAPHALAQSRSTGDNALSRGVFFRSLSAYLREKERGRRENEHRVPSGSHTPTSFCVRRAHTQRARFGGRDAVDAFPGNRICSLRAERSAHFLLDGWMT